MLAGTAALLTACLTGGIVRLCCARVQLQVDAAAHRRAGHAQLQAGHKRE